MVEALRRCRPRYKTACLTNNVSTANSASAGDAAAAAWFADGSGARAIEEVMSLFDVIVESSVLGVRKPDPRFYQIACERLGVTPEETVFLDDLGVNLKPARALGMTTLKVVDPATTLRELESILGLDLTWPGGGRPGAAADSAAGRPPHGAPARPACPCPGEQPKPHTAPPVRILSLCLPRSWCPSHDRS